METSFYSGIRRRHDWDAFCRAIPYPRTTITNLNKLVERDSREAMGILCRWYLGGGNDTLPLSEKRGIELLHKAAPVVMELAVCFNIGNWYVNGKTFLSILLFEKIMKVFPATGSRQSATDTKRRTKTWQYEADQIWLNQGIDI